MFFAFQELILCLHRISECNCAYSSTSSQNSSAHSSKIAQFIFLLMEPDDEVRLICCLYFNYIIHYVHFHAAT